MSELPLCACGCGQQVRNKRETSLPTCSCGCGQHVSRKGASCPEVIKKHRDEVRHRYQIKNHEKILASRVAKREKDNAWRRNYYQNNKEKEYQRLKEWRLDNPEKYAAQLQRSSHKQAEWRSSHPEEAHDIDANDYIQRKEYHDTKNLAWRKKNKDKVRSYVKQRRAKKMNAPINDLSSEQWLEILVVYNYRCVYCPTNCWRCTRKKHALTQDHITPLSKGGSHTFSNIVPACHSCNSSKKAREAKVPVQPLLFTIAINKKPRRKHTA